MTWQYRICLEGGKLYLHEFYMDEGQYWGHTNPMMPHGKNIDEVINDLHYMLQAAEAYKEGKYEAIDLGPRVTCSKCGARQMKDTVPDG